jgi:hypothetical protein
VALIALDGSDRNMCAGVDFHDGGTCRSVTSTALTRRIRMLSCRRPRSRCVAVITCPWSLTAFVCCRERLSAAVIALGFIRSVVAGGTRYSRYRTVETRGISGKRCGTAAVALIALYGTSRDMRRGADFYRG